MGRWSNDQALGESIPGKIRALGTRGKHAICPCGRARLLWVCWWPELGLSPEDVPPQPVCRHRTISRPISSVWRKRHGGWACGIGAQHHFQQVGQKSLPILGDGGVKASKDQLSQKWTVHSFGSLGFLVAISVSSCWAITFSSARALSVAWVADGCQVFLTTKSSEGSVDLYGFCKSASISWISM